MPPGVEFALPVPGRVFLEDERGVTLLLMKDFTGVTSSYTAVFTRGVAPRALRAGRPAGVLAVEGAASRGATGVFAVRAVARVGFNGREVFVFVRSMGMSAVVVVD